jgi:hypothetical protein
MRHLLMRKFEFKFLLNKLKPEVDLSLAVELIGPATQKRTSGLLKEFILTRGGQPTARGHFFALEAIFKCP